MEAASESLNRLSQRIRRRPAPGCTPQGQARMPECWAEFAGDELRWALAETRYEADAMLDFAYALEVRLPGTREAFRTGVLRQSTPSTFRWTTPSGRQYTTEPTRHPI